VNGQSRDKVALDGHDVLMRVVIAFFDSEMLELNGMLIMSAILTASSARQ